MDNLRTLFIFGLLIVSLLLWQAWQKDYVHPQQAEQNTPSTQVDDASLAANDAELPDLPSASAQALPDDVPESAQSSAATKQNIHVKTDVMDIEISTQGGDIQNLALLKYAVSSEEPNTPVQFLSDKSDAYFVSQSGLRSNMDVPTHYAVYKADQQNYQLRDGQDEIKVPLYWQADNGLTVVKTYTFKRDSYVVNVDYKGYPEFLVDKMPKM
jgi:YidC/Oxa1 family membrane protein insertase